MTRHVKFVNLGAQFADLNQQITAKFIEISMQGAYILSEDVRIFEAAFAEYCDAKYAIGVANGTDALFLLLKAMNIGPGDEVITVPNSFIATAGAIVMTGATPVFVDAREDYNMNPDLINAAITKKTKAIMPVHLTGMPCDMSAILEIAQQNNLRVVEDCAQAIGATYKGTKVGAIGDGGGFSLHPLKNLHVHGDGGVITTNDAQLNNTIRQYQNHGLINRDACQFWGYNSRLDGIHAAIGTIKLKKIDQFNRRFRQIAAMYHDALKDVTHVPVIPPHCEGVFHNFVITTKRRDELQTYLLNQGVETKVHYPIPIHLQEAAQALGYRQGDFPLAEKQAQQILSLPIYPELSDEDVSWVIKSVCDFFRSKTP